MTNSPPLPACEEWQKLPIAGAGKKSAEALGQGY
jgi:hypothetical protein